jgi:hypothetical protein
MQGTKSAEIDGFGINAVNTTLRRDDHGHGATV